MNDHPIGKDIDEPQEINNKNKIYWKTVFFLLALIICSYNFYPQIISYIDSLRTSKVPTNIKTILPSSAVKNPKQYIPITESTSLVIRDKKTKKQYVNISLSYGMPHIATWNNYFFYIDEARNKQAVYAFNFDDKTKSTIYEVINQTKHQEIQLNNLSVYDNTLFFTPARYVSNSSVYYLPLPPTTSPQILTEAGNSGIVNFNGTPFLFGGVIDGCGGIEHYRLFDSKTRSLGPEIESNTGCIDGNKVLGVNRNGKFITAYHEVKQNPPPDQEDPLSSFYKSATITDPATNNLIETLINEQSMPQNVTSMHYFEESDKIGLTINLNKFVVYDPSLKKFSDSNLKPASDDRIIKFFEISPNTFCVVQGDMYNVFSMSIFEYNSNTGGAYTKAREPHLKCSQMVDDITASLATKVQTKIKDFKLPEGFEIVVE